jgi:hypothetical protein
MHVLRKAHDPLNRRHAPLPDISFLFVTNSRHPSLVMNNTAIGHYRVSCLAPWDMIVALSFYLLPHAKMGRA